MAESTHVRARRRSQSPEPSGAEQRAFWRKALGSTPNQITTLRAVLVPGLWMLAMLQMPVALGFGLAIAASTDVVDGYVARRRGLTTEFGSRFAFVDHLLTASAVIWVLLLRPEFFQAHRTLLLCWLGLGILALLIGLLRFGRLGDLHPYSAKAAGMLRQRVRGLSIRLGQLSCYRLQFVSGVCLVAAAETLLIQLVRASADERIDSIVQRRRGDGRGASAPGNQNRALEEYQQHGLGR